MAALDHGMALRPDRLLAARLCLAALAPRALALAALGVFLVTALRHLDTVPQVYEDEPWQASTAYKLMHQGVLGSDLFAGFYNMDQRYFGFMPLHPFALAGFFKVFGVGLAQARLETVVMGALTLVLSYALGARLFGPWVGAVAVAMLVLVRWTGLTYLQLTGIPLVDFSRIARYDPLVPVLGLASLHVYLSGRDRSGWWLVLAGALAGLSGLAHLYGLFWLPALALLAFWDGRRGAIGWLALGAALPWLPYAAFVLSDLPDWSGQTLIYANRFELLSLPWYLDNLLQEFHRYGPGLGPFGPAWLLRVGWWVALIAGPISLALLFKRAFRGDSAARAIVVPALVFPVLFALLIKLKLVNYTLVELPLFAVATAWAGVAAWRSAAPDKRWLKPLLATLGLVLIAEGGVQLIRLEQAAATMTPYPTFIAEVRGYLPPGARVLALHTYWFGLEDRDVRSFLVPLNFADEGLPLDQGLARVDPDVVLLDARMRGYFATPEAAADGVRFFAWLDQHAGQLIGRIDDPTYGLMEVYRVQR
jgi:hypothetical protein